MKRSLILAACLLLAACGNELEGTYSDAMGVTKYTFKSDDKVYMSTMGVETELPYSIEGDKVKIGGADGNVILTLKEDGTLAGPMGITLSKQAE